MRKAILLPVALSLLRQRACSVGRASRLAGALVVVLVLLVSPACSASRPGTGKRSMRPAQQDSQEPPPDRADAAATKDPVERTIGSSAQGRPIVVHRFGHGRRRILVIGGVHGNEFGIPVAQAFSDYLAEDPSAIPTDTEVDLIAVANPDGAAARTRLNSHDVDVNRNFPTRNWRRSRAESPASGQRPASEPETRALMRCVSQGGYMRVISLHSRGGLVDYDGPGGSSLASRISRASGVRILHLARHGDYRGSMGNYVSQCCSLPVITWELAGPDLSSGVLAGLLEACRPGAEDRRGSVGKGVLHERIEH